MYPCPCGNKGNSLEIRSRQLPHDCVYFSADSGECSISLRQSNAPRKFIGGRSVFLLPLVLDGLQGFLTLIAIL